MDYEEWEKTVPQEIKGDALWRVTAYRLALYVADLGWLDVTALMKDRRTVSLSDQMYRALGSIGANISEGFSRGTGKDRARFYEYSLGSTREARGWYFDGRHVLGPTVANHRIGLLTEIIRLLLKMIPQQRSYAVHDEIAPYGAVPDVDLTDEFDNSILDGSLLKNVPVTNSN
jgi:four helix bundle protein